MRMKYILYELLKKGIKAESSKEYEQEVAKIVKLLNL